MIWKGMYYAIQGIIVSIANFVIIKIYDYIIKKISK